MHEPLHAPATRADSASEAQLGVLAPRRRAVDIKHLARQGDRLRQGKLAGVKRSSSNRYAPSSLRARPGSGDMRRVDVTFSTRRRCAAAATSCRSGAASCMPSSPSAAPPRRAGSQTSRSTVRRRPTSRGSRTVGCVSRRSRTGRHTSRETPGGHARTGRNVWARWPPPKEHDGDVYVIAAKPAFDEGRGPRRRCLADDRVVRHQ